MTIKKNIKQYFSLYDFMYSFFIIKNKTNVSVAALRNAKNLNFYEKKSIILNI